MKHWMNAVGYGIPTQIHLAKKYIQKGDHVWAQWYGRYSLDKSTWAKMRLIIQNGERRKHYD